MQVPFEVSGELQLVDSNHAVYAPPGLIAIDVDGQAGRGFSFQPVPDNVHTITTCDLAQDTRSSSICNRQLFHADGSIVDENSPARPGEGVAVYVYGLGPTQPSAPSGAYPPGGAAVTDILGRPRIGVSFQSGILNALNSSPRSTDQNRPPDSLPVAVISAGLFFGQIGIYQINFAVPAEIPLPYPCGNGIHTNSVFRIITSQGSEEIALCVRQ
jgi:hypothetical protein